MEIDICASARRKLAEGKDLVEPFVFFSKKWKDLEAWNVPKILATLEAGGIDTSAIRAGLEQAGINHRHHRQEESPVHPLGK
jgi:hypothetical protein